MPSPATRRLIKDLQKFQKQQDQFIVNPLKDDLMLWTATFEGAQDTIWEGGLFTLKLVFTQQYPNVPPRVKFLNKMFHPNIYNDGRICLDMLSNQWSPIYDVWAILTAIKTLITDPNTQSPANIEASNIFRDNKIEYEYRVKEIVQKSLQFEIQDDKIIKQTQEQIKQRELEQAKAEKLQKQRQQRQAKKYDHLIKNTCSYKAIKKSAGFGLSSPGVYKIADLARLNQEQNNALLNQSSSEEDSQDYLHTQSGELKENFTEPQPLLQIAIELQPIKLENIQNSVLMPISQNQKKDQQESTEVVIPAKNSETENIDVKLQQGQQKISNQESQAKQDQLILKKQYKQERQVQQKKNENQEDQKVKKYEKIEINTKNEKQANQLPANLPCLDQFQQQKQEQLEDYQEQVSEDSDYDQIQEPLQAQESSDQQK